MVDTGYVIGRRVNADGKTVGERHAVTAAAARTAGPYRAECGAAVQVVVGDWPPAGGAEEHACPVCARDTGTPWV